VSARPISILNCERSLMGNILRLVLLLSLCPGKAMAQSPRATATAPVVSASLGYSFTSLAIRGQSNLRRTGGFVYFFGKHSSKHQ
jgi:hypothetical protein